ncbi:acyl-CoA thioesterase [Maribacter dokdonensis]|uniref:acyl-CoA thioesterase n=1 Tax=Maribacter dokdonensis TaxID=320912 RepID=UPI001C091EEB|nr:acyl-CoA thioesterase [Maribacter dokdonensis]MBU2902973.1 acyl-CoA thioesterase [Maribacter dokdonensis]
MPFIKTETGAYFEYRFTTSFEETNLVGNIYFANYALWQGKCREMFIKEYCSDVVKEINDGLKLITVDLGLQFVSQLFALQDVVIRMSLEAQSEFRMMMNFEYYRSENEALHLVCKGHQSTTSMKLVDDVLTLVPFPKSMIDAVEQYKLIQQTI